MLRNVYRLLSTKRDWSDCLTLDNSCFEDLSWWHSSLRAWNGRLFLIHNTTDIFQIETDASKLGWGGHIVNTKLQAQGYWEHPITLRSSNFRELSAVLNCLKSFGPTLKNSRVQILTDNVTTAA